jgi:dTDP-4-dehydrorhamnose reductase
VLARLRRGDKLRVDDERRVSPTWVTPLADLSAAVALTEAHGLFHATSHGDTTWAEFARTLARLAGVAAPQIQAMSSQELALKAARPRRAVLDNRRLRELGLDLLDDWAAEAERYVATCRP